MNYNRLLLGTVVIVIITAVSFLLLGNRGLSESTNISNNVSCTAGCTSCDVSGQTEAVTDLSPDEKKIVDYITNQIVSENRFKFEDEEITQETGVSVDILNESRLQTAVMAELKRRNVNLDAIACVGNCAKFSACSVDRNLNGATGEDLTRYQAEKTEDGKIYSDLRAPVFTIPMTNGDQFSLTDYLGRPVAIVTLSVHCYHSMQTLPILERLKKKYDGLELKIVPVFVNANSVKDIQDTIEGFELSFPVGVAEGKTLTESYNSRMVPSVFLIDSQGYITKKFVGQKDESTLDQAFSDLLYGISSSKSLSDI